MLNINTCYSIIINSIDRYENCLKWINLGGLPNFVEYLPNAKNSTAFDVLEVICSEGTFSSITISILTIPLEQLLPYAIAAGLPEKLVESLESLDLEVYADCVKVLVQLADDSECMYAYLLDII